MKPKDNGLKKLDQTDISVDRNISLDISVWKPKGDEFYDLTKNEYFDRAWPPSAQNDKKKKAQDIELPEIRQRKWLHKIEEI